MITSGWLSALHRLVMVLRIHASYRENGGKRREREGNQKFSEVSMNQNSSEDLLKHGVLSFMPELLINCVGWGREFALPTSSQVILVVLIQGQCFENFYPKHKRFKPERRLKFAAGTAVDPGRLNLITVFRDRSLTGHSWYMWMAREGPICPAAAFSSVLRFLKAGQRINSSSQTF